MGDLDGRTPAGPSPTHQECPHAGSDVAARLECSDPRADSRQQVTGGIGTHRLRPRNGLFPVTRDRVREEGVDVPPRTIGSVDASGQAEDAGDKRLDD